MFQKLGFKRNKRERDSNKNNKFFILYKYTKT